MTPGATLGVSWTAGEDATVRTAYSTGGILAAVAALPGRTRASIYHRAERLGLSRRRRWTRRDDLRLEDLWSEGVPLRAIARQLGRTPATTYWRAQKLGLALGCPAGWEYLTAAARRTGYSVGQLRAVLRAAHVGVRRSISRRAPPRGTGRGRPTFIVRPEDVDDAVAAWLATEPLTAAARRLGMSAEALTWRLEALGVERPALTGRAHWRVRAEDVERAAAVTPLGGYVRAPRGGAEASP